MPADVQPNRPGLTDQQRRAVGARGASVALSAGAGCGKTFVLTERFLAELEPDGADSKPRLNQIAAITFTERAAREMRNRIRAACRRRLAECPEDQVDYWLSLIRELDTARISTIHSFCGSLLRAHAVEAGIDPRFRVLDGAQAGTLLFELTDDALRERLADGDEAALALVTRYGLDRLRGMIDRLLSVRQAIDWAAWRDETPESLVGRWQAFWRRDALPRLLRGIADSADAKTLLDLAMRYPPNHPVMRERCDRLLELLPKLSDAADAPGTGPFFGEKSSLAEKSSSENMDLSPCDLLTAIREAAKVQGGGTKKNWATEEVYGRFRDAAKGLRDAIDAAKDHASFNAEAARPAAETALLLLNLAGDVAGEYDRRKRELAALDFNDLLIEARNLLTGPDCAAVRRRLAAQIRLLLVDEFQDTDPLQVELVKSLCDNEHLRGKLFFVGDHKQSIYRFRGADPSVFRLLREEVPAEGRLPLSLNFRSQPAILEFVNTLFCDELGPDYEPLRASRPQVSPTPAVEFLWANETNECLAAASTRGEAEADLASKISHSSPSSFSLSLSDDLGPRERLRRREADWIARRIRGLLDSGEKIVWDEDAAKNSQPSARAVRLGDFALLFRALTNVEYYEEALQRYGIDYYLVGGRAFYAQQEIYDLLNLLRAIDIPGDVLSLAGALRSPMFGLLDETLFWLSRQPGGLAVGLMAGELPEQIDERQRQLTVRAASTLRALRAVKDRLPIARLIQEALRLTEYDAALLAEFLGERKLANLHKLVEQARSFDRAGIFSLSDFITQLSEFVVRQPDEALAATHPESTDVVKLMSIHQSKGLEFPVVIVPDVGRPRRAMGPSVAFTPELGPLLKDEKVTTGYDLFMAAERDEELAETSRLLYVATTRAADYLILSAGVEKPGDAAGPWMELLASRFDLASGERVERENERAEGGERRAEKSVASGEGPRFKVQGSIKERGEGGGEKVASGQWRVASESTESRNPEIPKSPNPSLLATRHSPLATASSPQPPAPRPSHFPLRVTTQEPPVPSKPVDLRLRRDLMKIIEKAGQMAGDGQGRQPRFLAPVPADAAARRQYSFSRLTGMLHAPSGDCPDFCVSKNGTVPFAGAVESAAEETSCEPPLDARGLGTLVHAVLEEIDFGNPIDIGDRVRRLADQHLPESERRLAEPIEMIERFAASPRAAQLAAAKEVYRELEFMLAWPPGGDCPDFRVGDCPNFCVSDNGTVPLDPRDAAKGQQINICHPERSEGSSFDAQRSFAALRMTVNPDSYLFANPMPASPFLQGFIDCLYLDADGRWRLIDYKTNQTTAATLAATAAAYEMQMLVYGLAAETILKTPPAELTLCFLRPGLEHSIAWDAAARWRAVEMVDRAIRGVAFESEKTREDSTQ